MTKYGWRDNSITTKKLIVKGKMPVSYVIPFGILTSTSAILSGFDLAAHTTNAITGTSLSAQPPYPVKLKLTVGSSANTATDTLKFVGVDAKGKNISEFIAVPQTLGSTIDTVNAYGRITTIKSNVTSDSNDISLGYATTIGLPYPIASSGDIISYAINGVAGTTLNKSGGLTINSTYDTLVIPTMAAVGSTISVLYNTELQE